MAKSNPVDLTLYVTSDSGKPLYQQIYEQIRSLALSGSIEEGRKLPSIRTLSCALGVSHTTVEQAYLQLSVEGIARNVPRSGYVVEKFDTEFLQEIPDAVEERFREVAAIAHGRDQEAFYAENAKGRKVRYDFSYANLPRDAFPAKIWRQLINDVLYKDEIPEMSRYMQSNEPSGLCAEIARYVSRARGARCTAEQVVLQPGTDNALNTLFQLFDRRCHVVGIEEPGYATAIEAARRNGFRIAPLTVVHGADAFLRAIDEAKPKIIFATPSHQFPTGKVLSLDARIRLLKWAEQNNAYIIEDDSCNEYRYNSLPIPSLQSLDAHNRVIYLCNVSKVLSPSVRIAYFVLPPKLLRRYLMLFNHTHPSTPWLVQEALARFFSQGHWDAQVRRMARSLHKRHDVLLECLQLEMGDRVEVSGVFSGMHFYLNVRNGMSQEQLLDSARKHDAQVYGTSRMWQDKENAENAVMIGFSAISPEEIPGGVRALKDAWF